MSKERIEGKEKKEYGKAEEKIGKEFNDKERQEFGKQEKESGKAQEKVGKEMEKRGMASPPAAGQMQREYVCASCGAAFGSENERNEHNRLVHRPT